jgi:hypothetical protein
MTGMKVSVDARVKRGPETWAYIYTVLGFVVAIEATVIGVMTPLEFPWNVVVFIALTTVTIWLFVENAWLQNKLVGIKMRCENKAR